MVCVCVCGVCTRARVPVCLYAYLYLSARACDVVRARDEWIRSVRLAGFELLLGYLDVVDNADESEQELVATAINLIPFTIDYERLQLRYGVLQASDRTQVLLPAQGVPTKAETLDFINALLDFAMKRPGNFEFWFRMLKQYFFPTFYPAKCRELGLLDKSSTTGFAPYAPPPVQAALIERLGTTPAPPPPAKTSTCADRDLGRGWVRLRGDGERDVGPGAARVVDARGVPAGPA